MTDQAVILAKLSGKPQSAESVARALGYDKDACRWIVPALNAAQGEGKAVRVMANEDGNVHWRLP